MNTAAGLILALLAQADAAKKPSDFEALDKELTSIEEKKDELIQQLQDETPGIIGKVSAHDFGLSLPFIRKRLNEKYAMPTHEELSRGIVL